MDFSRSAGGRSVDFGAYVRRTRLAIPGERELAAYASVLVGPTTTVRLNSLRYQHDPYLSAGAQDGSLWSCSVEANPSRYLDAAAELAYSRSSRPGYEADWGARLAATGELSRDAFYTFEHIQAQPSFWGNFKDTRSTQLSTGLHLAHAMYAQVSLRASSQNLESRPERYVAPRDRRLEALVSYSPSARWYLTGQYAAGRKENTLAVSGYRENEQVLGGSAGYQSDASSARIETQLTYRHDRPGGNRVYAARLYGSGDWKPTDDLRVGLAAGVSELPLGATSEGDVRRLEQGEITIAWRAPKWFALSARLGHYSFPSQRARDRDTWELRGTASLPKVGIIEAAAYSHAAQVGSATETAVMVRHTLPFAVPFIRRTSVGGVEGFVYDTEGGTQRGVPGILVEIAGRAGISDHAGRFAIAPVPIGRHVVSIDPRTMLRDRVARQWNDYRVEVGAATVARLEIELVRPARVVGRVTLATASCAEAASRRSPTSPPPAQGGRDGGAECQTEITSETDGDGAAADILVELRKGDDVAERFTGPGGRFVFERLPPGPWVLSVRRDTLPRGYASPREPLPVVLAPGQELTVDVTLEPARRRVRMIDSGTISE